MILVEGFIDSINGFLANKENIDVFKCIAVMMFYTTASQLESKISDKLIKALLMLLDKTEDQLFYTVLKALRRNIRLASSSTLVNVTNKLFGVWE